MPSTEWTPTTAAELSRLLAENFRGARQPVVPVGGRTAMHFGNPVPSESALISTAGLDKIIDYPARDMTVTVEAGLRVSALQEQLAVERQRLPVEVAQAHRATIGGAIAADTCGPNRYRHGSFRDVVLGITAIDGQGRLFSAGGRVVKNVAGYDLCKLMTGSLGTLGVITQVTLKVIPLTPVTSVLCALSNESERLESVLAALNLSETLPSAIELLNERAIWQMRNESRHPLPEGKSAICLVFEGTPEEISWQIDQAQQEIRPAGIGEFVSLQGEVADRFVKSLIEFPSASDDPLTFQAVVPPSKVVEFLTLVKRHDIAAQSHAGNGLIIGHFPDRCLNAITAANLLEPLRTFTGMVGGQLVILDCDEQWKSALSVFGPPTAAWEVMRQIQKVMDPAGVLSPGRLFSPARG